jgi:hypothetical protein
MKSILGLDIGFGAVKCVFFNRNGEVSSLFKFPSAIGVTKRNEFVSDNRIYDYRENSYYIGNDALMLPSENLVDITEYKNLEYYAPLFAYRAIEMIGETPDIIVTGLSKAQITNSGYFKETLQNFTVNSKNFNFEELYILPQGAGSKLTIDKYGMDFPKPQTTFNGQSTFVGVDIGFNTLDLFLVTNGKTSPNLFEGVEHEGVMKIARGLAAVIKEKYNREISLQEAQEILDTKIYKLRGQRFDMQEDITTIRAQYLKELVELINLKYDKIIDKCDFVFLSGGGSALFNSAENSFFKVPKSHNEYYNAIGFALWAQKTKI